MQNPQIGWHYSTLKYETVVNRDIKNMPYFNVISQVFTKSPLKNSGITLNREILNVASTTFVHSQYLLNFLNPTEYYRTSLIEDLIFVGNNSKSGVVLHLGKNVNKLTLSECIDLFANEINYVIKTANVKCKLILETSTKAKNGNDVFYDIGSLAMLDAKLKHLLKEDYSKIGYCIDTAHIWASGYNIQTNFDGFISMFENKIGKPSLIHLNDSKAEIGSCRDLHEQVGQGCIYKHVKTGLNNIINYSITNDIPIIIESHGNRTEEYNLITSFF